VDWELFGERGMVSLVCVPVVEQLGRVVVDFSEESLEKGVFIGGGSDGDEVFAQYLLNHLF
jgi:hypothetical protein